MSSGTDELVEVVRKSLRDLTLRKAVFSKPGRGVVDGATPSRVDVRPVKIGERSCFQVTSRVGNQDHHENLTPEEAEVRLVDLPGQKFLDILVQTTTEEIVGRHSRRGVCRLTKTSRQSSAQDDSAVDAHNRSREYLISDSQPVPFLVATGVMTAGGRVKDQQRKKFRQINRYAEFIRDVVAQIAKPTDEPISVVDFGCGKSYLTFATHFVLTQVLGRTVRIVGLDRRPDVIATCTRIVDQLQLTGIQFRTGDIADYQPQGPVHIAVSLHACDTATDDALAVAASWGSDAILAVPCCQHELAGRLPRQTLPIFSRHGILHERFSSLATDAIRASLMECAGYKTQVLEFIDTEHTPKNLLIRCLKRHDHQRDSPDPQYRSNFTSFSEQLGVGPLRLQAKLEECGLISFQPADR